MKERRQVLRALLLTAGLTVGGLSAAASGAAAASAVTLYASPSGSGTACSASTPCSVATAQQQVQSQDQNMSSDIDVDLYGGTYRMSAPLQLGVADSGTNGHTVVWQNVPGQTPVFSGGTQVTGWQQYDASKNIYRAPVSAGTQSLQLFVNGVRAQVTNSAPNPSGFTHTSAGFDSTDPKYLSWKNPTSIEIVDNTAWKHLSCPVASITADGNGGSLFTMAQPCFANGGASPIQSSDFPYHGSDGVNFSGVTYVENAYELLNTPGEFYLDSAGGYVYYISRPGENLATADVELPTTQTLVSMSGTPGHLSPVNDTDPSISYAGSGWNYTSGTTHGDLADDIHWTTNNGDSAAITFTGTGIEVLDETYTDSGSIAVYLDGSSTPDATVTAATAGPDINAQQVIYSKTGLSQGAHTVKLVKQSGSYMRLDGYVPITAAIAPVHDITMQGITFNYTTWSLPLSGDGYRDRQGGEIWAGYPTFFSRVPGAVTVSRGANITFSGDVLAHLGDSGIDFANGTQNSQIVGNQVYDVSGQGINVGEIDDFWQAVPSLMTSGDTVNDNYVAYVGQDYPDAVGIMAGYTYGATIDHNEVAHTPYTGISMGWSAGWTSSCALQATANSSLPCRHGSDYAGDNHIDYNYVHDVMRVLNDGGLIYTWGGQNATVNQGKTAPDSTAVYSTITGNVLSTASSALGAAQGLYMDEGSSWWIDSNNVISQTAQFWTHEWIKTIHDEIIQNTYTDDTNYNNNGTNIIITGTTNVTNGQWPQAAQNIVASAGLESAYKHLEFPEAYLQNDSAFGSLLAPGTIIYSGTGWFIADPTTPGQQPDLDKDLHVTGTNGDSATFNFTGSGIEVFGQTGSNQAAMSVTLDGKSAGTVSAITTGSLLSQQPVYQVANLTYGSHTVVLTKTGGSYATIDGYLLSKTINDNDPSLTYSGSWSASTSRGAGDYNDDVHLTSTNGDSVSASFAGTGISFITEKSPPEGHIDVYVDGQFRQTVDAYEGALQAQDTVYSISGLPKGTHTLKLVKDDGSQMVVDRFDVSPSAPEPTPIVGKASSRCADIPGANNTDGNELQLYDCNNTSAQQWTFVNGTVQAMGKCMDVSGGSSTDLTPVDIYTCNGTAAQQWTLAPQTGELQAFGKCLDAENYGTGNGTKLILYTCHPDSSQGNQQWSATS